MYTDCPAPEPMLILLTKKLEVHIDVKVASLRSHSSPERSTADGIPRVAMVTDLWWDSHLYLDRNMT